MIHRDFHEPIAGTLDKRRNKTVHALERNQRAHTFAPHRLQCATCIAHAVFRETAANGVGYPARQPLHRCVLASRSIATDEIGAVCDFSEKLGNVRGIILQIAINENCGRAKGSLEPNVNGGALSRIFFETNHSNMRCRFDSLDRSINRSVVHKNDFIMEFTQRCAQLGL